MGGTRAGNVESLLPSIALVTEHLLCLAKEVYDHILEAML